MAGTLWPERGWRISSPRRAGRSELLRRTASRTRTENAAAMALASGYLALLTALHEERTEAALERARASGKLVSGRIGRKGWRLTIWPVSRQRRRPRCRCSTLDSRNTRAKNRPPCWTGAGFAAIANGWLCSRLGINPETCGKTKPARSPARGSVPTTDRSSFQEHARPCRQTTAINTPSNQC